MLCAAFALRFPISRCILEMYQKVDSVPVSLSRPGRDIRALDAWQCCQT
jgi:hypothetical protein